MMQNEKNLSKTDLKNYKVDILEQFILQCYKYQKYKTSVALKKINRAHFSERTAANYLDLTKQYLCHGTKSKNMSARIYALLDQFKASHVAILQVSKEDEYTPRKLYKANPLHPQPTTRTTRTKPQPTKPTQYGVKHENTIKMFDSKEFCLGYKECFETFNTDKKADLIKVSYELVEEN